MKRFIIQHSEKTVMGPVGKENEVPEYELQGFWDLLMEQQEQM